MEKAYKEIKETENFKIDSKDYNQERKKIYISTENHKRCEDYKH